jgi:hypothetical protein
LPELCLNLWIAAEQQNTEDRRRERHEAITQQKRAGLLPRANLMSTKKFPQLKIFRTR